MSNSNPIPFVPGQNDRDDASAGLDAPEGDDLEQPLDPDADDDQVDSASADIQAATEGTLPASDD